MAPAPNHATVLSRENDQATKEKPVMSTATYTLHIVRGEQPDAAGAELGQSDLEGVDLGQDVWGWLEQHGAGADDLTWVLVTAAAEHPGELRNLVAQRDVTVETTA